MFPDQAGWPHYTGKTEQCHAQDIQETGIKSHQEVDIRAAEAQPGAREIEDLPNLSFPT